MQALTGMNISAMLSFTIDIRVGTRDRKPITCTIARIEAIRVLCPHEGSQFGRVATGHYLLVKVHIIQLCKF